MNRRTLGTVLGALIAAAAVALSSQSADSQVYNNALPVTCNPPGMNCVPATAVVNPDGTTISGGGGAVKAAANSYAAGAIVDIGTGGSPAANTVNARLVTLNTTLAAFEAANHTDLAAILTAPPLSVTATDKSGSITTGGTAQTAIASNGSRKSWCVSNPPDATEPLSVRVGTTATSTTGVRLGAGQQACNPPGMIDTSAISVIAATTGHVFEGTEYQ